MIRVVTIDELAPEVPKQLNKTLFQAFGVGSEHVGSVEVPAGLAEPLEAARLLQELPGVRAFADDKVLYVTTRKLAARKLASGEAPTFGLSQYNGQRAIVSAAHIKNLPENVEALARLSLHELGHTWGLHHCLDPRCSMYPPWTPSYPEQEPIFCVFCREQSEQRIRLTKS